MGPISTGLGEIYQFEVRGEPGSELHADGAAHHPRLVRSHRAPRRVPGVVEVNAFGGELKTYQVQLDPDALARYDCRVARVFERARAQQPNAGGGYIEKSGEQYLVRGEGLVEQPRGHRRHRAQRRRDGTPIYVRDVGRGRVRAR